LLRKKLENTTPKKLDTSKKHPTPTKTITLPKKLHKTLKNDKTKHNTPKQKEEKHNNNNTQIKILPPTKQEFSPKFKTRK
jgi:hypothetical protein